MFQPKSLFFGLFIFIISILLGIGGYFFVLTRCQIPGMSWNFKLNTPTLRQKIVNDQHLPSEKVFKYSAALNPTPVPTESVNLINPFIIPGSYNVSFKKVRSQSKHEQLEYQGAIETDTSILGLVRINATGESLVVSEGEDIVVSGIIIGKITPKTLTYSQNGIEKVIYLGGASN